MGTAFMGSIMRDFENFDKDKDLKSYNMLILLKPVSIRPIAFVAGPNRKSLFLFY